jgi:beta-N-acetylhexosaminidase
MLLIGFYGKSTRSLSARMLARQVRRGQVGGVFFVNANIGTREDVEGLVRLFESGRTAPLLAIDHEGGIVQRLTQAHGLTLLPSARDMADQATPAEARDLYAQAGRELAALRFNVNLGPVVDFDNPANPAIGTFGRAYGTDPNRIAAYAAAFVEGFASAGVICALKHFPGHGNSVGDSHDGVADISATWTEAELLPFAHLIGARRAPMVMGGHLRMATIETSGSLTTFSPAVMTDLLRHRLGYRGVVLTDDLDMDAVRRMMGRRTAIVQAIRAGNDLLMMKNVEHYDPLLPQRAVRWVRAAIADGTLREAEVIEAAERIRALR